MQFLSFDTKMSLNKIEEGKRKMNKISYYLLETIKTLFMPLIFVVLFLYLRNFSDILIGIYIFFPLCYILQAVFLSCKMYHIITAYISSSVFFLVLMEQWFRVADVMLCITVYLILGFVCYAIKKCVIKRKNKSRK